MQKSQAALRYIGRLKGRHKAMVTQVCTRIHSDKTKPKTLAPFEQIHVASLCQCAALAPITSPPDSTDLPEEAPRLADKIGGVVALVGEDEGKARMVIAMTKP